MSEEHKRIDCTVESESECGIDGGAGLWTLRHGIRLEHSLELCYRRQRNPGTVFSSQEKLNDFSLSHFVPPNVGSQSLNC